MNGLVTRASSGALFFFCEFSTSLEPAFHRGPREEAGEVGSGPILDPLDSSVYRRTRRCRASVLQDASLAFAQARRV